jgi:hypothetical protein
MTAPTTSICFFTEGSSGCCSFGRAILIEEWCFVVASLLRCAAPI